MLLVRVDKLEKGVCCVFTILSALVFTDLSTVVFTHLSAVVFGNLPTVVFTNLSTVVFPNLSVMKVAFNFKLSTGKSFYQKATKFFILVKLAKRGKNLNVAFTVEFLRIHLPTHGPFVLLGLQWISVSF